MLLVAGLCAATCTLWITVYYVSVCVHLVCWYVHTYVVITTTSTNNKVEPLLLAVTVVTSPIAVASRAPGSCVMCCYMRALDVVSGYALDCWSTYG